MPLLDIVRVVREKTRDERYSFRANNDKLGLRFIEVFARTWDLGFTVCAPRDLTVTTSCFCAKGLTAIRLLVVRLFISRFCIGGL